MSNETELEKLPEDEKGSAIVPLPFYKISQTAKIIDEYTKLALSLELVRKVPGL